MTDRILSLRPRKTLVRTVENPIKRSNSLSTKTNISKQLNTSYSGLEKLNLEECQTSSTPIRLSKYCAKSAKKSFEKFENFLKEVNFDKSLFDQFLYPELEDTPEAILNKKRETVIQEFLSASAYFDSALKMAQFDFEKALQYIPEFTGNFDDVENFINIADIFHARIGARNADQLNQFLAVIRLKLKEDAKERAIDIMADTWQEVQNNLNTLYQEKNTWPEILNSCNKLVQTRQESLEEYRRRADKLNRQIKQKGGNDAAEEILKENFIGGLQSTTLMQFAATIEECSYEDLANTILERGKTLERIYEAHKEKMKNSSSNATEGGDGGGNSLRNKNWSNKKNNTWRNPVWGHPSNLTQPPPLGPIPQPYTTMPNQMIGWQPNQTQNFGNPNRTLVPYGHVQNHENMTMDRWGRGPPQSNQMSQLNNTMNFNPDFNSTFNSNQNSTQHVPKN